MSFHVPEGFRIRAGQFASGNLDGNNGMFQLPGPFGRSLLARASDGGGWEHVSISATRSTPGWGEMSWVKELFWDAEDTVMQLHPPRSEWINNHPRCLHLWRPVGIEIPRPPAMMVGIPGLELPG